jgi:hypothetical protein
MTKATAKQIADIDRLDAGHCRAIATLQQQIAVLQERIATSSRRVAVHYQEISVLHMQRARLIALDWVTPAPAKAAKKPPKPSRKR